MVSGAEVIGILSDDAAGRNGQEIQRDLDVRTLPGLTGELAPRLVQRMPRPVEGLVGALEPGDRTNRKAASLQPLAVQAVGLRRIAGNHDVRRNVLQYDGAGAGD